ncbi:hypothetical protein LWI28_009441 [Acer negundo]|uniref:Uncharacterized protein n=1 Tax=Acer negundo TaxID=4023 RepID=A0AAD5JMI7_ACENE|nr:hypothetical protein LWI28_009441 [Acer negundo]
MFNFLCKTLLLHYGRRCTITSTSYNKDFAFPLFIKCISTATSNQHSFAVSYLINSCGFSQKSALSASKYLHFESPEKPDSVIALLKSHGFSETQISKVIRGLPQVLVACPERTLLPKFEFFYSKGFSSPELSKISSVCPQYLGRSLENRIIPTFNFLSDWFKSNETAIAAVKCCPGIFNLDVETYIAPSINVLRDIGVSERNILLFLRKWRGYNKKRFDDFKNNVEVVQEMGINPSRSYFVIALTAKSYGRIYWESKVEIFMRWGWSDEVFSAAFRKNPMFMLVSRDKIMTVMDFLVSKMGMESSAIAKRPDVIVQSMEKRFIPRSAVFQVLLSKGLINKKDINLITFFMCCEQVFLRKFVNSFDDAPKLLTLYQEKLGISKMTKSSVSKESIVCAGIQ